MHPSLWWMDFVQIFREVPEYVQWFTLGVSNFYVQRYKGNKIRTIHILPLLYWIFVQLALPTGYYNFTVSCITKVIQVGLCTVYNSIHYIRAYIP